MTWVPFALSIGVVAFISVAASYVPAWRASLLSPMVAIRDESSLRVAVDAPTFPARDGRRQGSRDDRVFSRRRRRRC